MLNKVLGFVGPRCGPPPPNPTLGVLVIEVLAGNVLVDRVLLVKLLVPDMLVLVTEGAVSNFAVVLRKARD